MKDCTTCKYYCIDYHKEWGGLIPGNYCIRNGFSPRDAIFVREPYINCSDYEEKEAEKPIDNSEEENPKPIEEKTVDWNQRRYELSKEFMSVIMGRNNYDPLTANLCYCNCGECGENNPYALIAEISVKAADALIKELKEKEVKNDKQ